MVVCEQFYIRQGNGVKQILIAKFRLKKKVIELKFWRKICTKICKEKGIKIKTMVHTFSIIVNDDGSGNQTWFMS